MRERVRRRPRKPCSPARINYTRLFEPRVNLRAANLTLSRGPPRDVTHSLPPSPRCAILARNSGGSDETCKAFAPAPGRRASVGFASLRDLGRRANGAYTHLGGTEAGNPAARGQES